MRSALLVVLLGCAPKIPDPPEVAPAPTPPPVLPVGYRVCWIELLTGEIPKGLAVAHGAADDDVPATQSGLLVQHPAGTWLIDGGMALDTDAEFEGVPWLNRQLLRRAASGWTRHATPVEGLAAVGVAPDELTGMIPTHGHFDHLGGLLAVPGPRISLPAAELAEAELALKGEATGITPVDAAGLVPRADVLTFPDGPIWVWRTSKDLFGDGTVVLFPLEGHTPGSVGVSVAVDADRTVVLVGDTVWVREGFEQRERKGWLARSFDADRRATDLQIGRLWSLHVTRPALHLVPAHDRRAWEDALGAPGCVPGPG